MPSDGIWPKTHASMPYSYSPQLFWITPNYYSNQDLGTVVTLGKWWCFHLSSKTIFYLMLFVYYGAVSLVFYSHIFFLTSVPNFFLPVFPTFPLYPSFSIWNQCSQVSWLSRMQGRVTFFFSVTLKEMSRVFFFFFFGLSCTFTCISTWANFYFLHIPIELG